PSGYIGIPQQWSESPVQEVDNSWFWVNHNLGNHGFGGGSGSSFGNSQGGYGLPGFGGNGTGLNGFYFDHNSFFYRSVSDPSLIVPWSIVSSMLTPYLSDASFLFDAINGTSSPRQLWSDTNRTNSFFFCYDPGSRKFFIPHTNKIIPDIMAAYAAHLNNVIIGGGGNAAGGGGNGLSNWWNSHWTAKVIPDVIYVNAGAVYSFVGGGSANTGYALPIRGKNSFQLYKTTTLISKGGVHGNIGVNLGYSSYVGDTRNLDFEKSFGGTGTRGFDSDIIFGIGGTVSSIDENGGRLYSYDLGLGLSIGASINIGSATYVKRLW
ncbi:MAG: hypothetical protein GX163_05105, partial [Bacteroidetes bacterium]|nr:hypothetical protein [Bacteroidota bacterium]